MRPVCNLQPLAKHTPGVWYQYPEVGKCGSYLAEEKPEAQGNYAALSEIHPFVLLLYAVLRRVTASSCVLLQARGQTVCGLQRMSFMYSEATPKQGVHERELSLPFFFIVERKSPSWILSGHGFSHGVSDFGICFKSCLPEPTTWQNADYFLVTASFKSEWCISLNQSHFTPKTFLFVLTTCKFHLKLSLHFPGCIMTFSSLSMWSMSVQKVLHKVLNPIHGGKQTEGDANNW